MSKALTQDEVKALVDTAAKEKRGKASSTIQWPKLDDYKELISAVEDREGSITLQGMLEEGSRLFSIKYYDSNGDLFFVMPTNSYTPNGCFSLDKMKRDFESYQAALTILEEQKLEHDA